MTNCSLFAPLLPSSKQTHIQWGNLHGCAKSLAIAEAIKQANRFSLIITPDTQTAMQLEYELRFFLASEPSLQLLSFPAWETLPYDVFSPHQDITSIRLATLSQLPRLTKGVLITPINTLMNRIAPADYLQGHCLAIKPGNQLNIEALRNSLQNNAYRAVSQVSEHGEYAVRGAIVDLFPMGSKTPFRIELFDDEIESIRSFDPDSQRSIDKLNAINLLPATEFSLTTEGIEKFRTNWRAHFHGNPANCPVYQDVSNGLATPGVEYFIPLFFDQTNCLLDHLPSETLLFRYHNIHQAAQANWQEINNRHEQLAHDITRPILAPQQAFINVSDLFQHINQFEQIELQTEALSNKPYQVNFSSSEAPDVSVNHKLKQPLTKLATYLSETDHRVLFCAETTGRREALLTLFQGIDLIPQQVDSWQSFLNSNASYCITTYPLDNSLVDPTSKLSVIAEPQLFGDRVLQRRRRKQQQTDSDALIKSLAELRIGDPVVHIDNGVGRYLGLQVIELNGQSDEYLTLEYAGSSKLYVPVSSLHLISRYTGTDTEHAPLHHLGSDSWQKAKRKAAEKIHDVAAELLEIYARRAANKGFSFDGDEGYNNFSESFPFEETPDQQTAIENVISDMQLEKPMDRLVCGDVGFGKTEVALRAAYIATSCSKQTVMLAPTTLLAQQHYQNFKDRFADWPVNVEVLSRFRTAKQQKDVIEKLESGQVDIVIGTHKLLNKAIKYANLGLLIIDEEHRFGVKQKEQIKSFRANVDILTLTATPIPRTLNMAFANIRDLSIIATPPVKRLAVKTFVQKRSNGIIKEAIQREILRGGQVYFLHNKVDTINKIAQELEELVPEARIGIGHGQMHERELEQVMADFYHRRFNVLISTTIIESGIDIPNANTIIIDRADHFGLAQLHQLRGRVGRSHHQAYAYLLIPDKKLITPDANKRLEAIASLKDLGVGFTLATHDLEIRGAGELLGDEQSGHMQEIGFTLYMSMLERAVNALKRGDKINLDAPVDTGPEVEIKISCIIPEDYLADVHGRLVLYKRIATAKNKAELDELKVEIVDRFGLLPQPVKNLFATTELKLKAAELGIKKLQATSKGGKLFFTENTKVEPATIIKLIQTHPNQFKLAGSDRLNYFHVEKTKPTEKFAQIEKVLELLRG